MKDRHHWPTTDPSRVLAWQEWALLAAILAIILIAVIVLAGPAVAELLNI